MAASGKVFLVGAGPGDPRLLTMRGAEVLREADLVLYDYLVNPRILDLAPRACECTCLGQHGRGSLWEPNRIHAAMIDAARAGRRVVRLKGGDPLVFARAAGELEALAAASIPFEIVPGITAALAAACYAGLPLTDRDSSSAVALVTGQQRTGTGRPPEDFEALAKFPGTLVIYMGVTTAAQWSAGLMQAGMPGDRQVALIRRCSWPDQRTLICRLDEVAERLTPYAKFPPPVLAVVGEVARHVDRWDWYSRQTLSGVTVLVTRPRDQAAPLARQLADLGADVLVQPAIEITPPAQWGEVDGALADLRRYAYVVFSSANGVRQFCGRTVASGGDFRAWGSPATGGPSLVALGAGTADALQEFHLVADQVPSGDYRAESVVELLAPQVQGKSVLLVRGDRGRDVLVAGLRAAGALVDQVVAYQSSDIADLSAGVRQRLEEASEVWITATSSAIARATMRLLGQRLSQRCHWASLSSLTSQTLRDARVEPTVEATEATMEELVRAIAEHAQQAHGR